MVIADRLDNGEQIPSQCLKQEKALLFLQKGFNFLQERYRDEAVSRPAGVGRPVPSRTRASRLEIVVMVDAPKMNV